MPSEKEAAMDERRDTGLNDGFGVSADEMLDALARADREARLAAGE